MNRELFTLRQDESSDNALQYLVTLGITGAPVLDASGKPIGFVSLRDLLSETPSGRVFERMSVPAATIDADAKITEAATRLCDDDLHHLVCTDDRGQAIGFVGSLDVMRGLLGRPIVHPRSFPHWDAGTGLCWSDQAHLDTAAEVAKDHPGLYVLIQAQPGRPDRVVWSEAVANVRDRLLRMIEVPGEAPAHLTDQIRSGALCFRAAVAPSVFALNAAADG